MKFPKDEWMASEVCLESPADEEIKKKRTEFSSSSLVPNERKRGGFIPSLPSHFSVALSVQSTPSEKIFPARTQRTDGPRFREMYNFSRTDLMTANGGDGRRGQGPAGMHPTRLPSLPSSSEEGRTKAKHIHAKNIHQRHRTMSGILNYQQGWKSVRAGVLLVLLAFSLQAARASSDFTWKTMTGHRTVLLGHRG